MHGDDLYCAGATRLFRDSPLYGGRSRQKCAVDADAGNRAFALVSALCGLRLPAFAGNNSSATLTADAEKHNDGGVMGAFISIHVAFQIVGLLSGLIVGRWRNESASAAVLICGGILTPLSDCAYGLGGGCWFHGALGFRGARYINAAIADLVAQSDRQTRGLLQAFKLHNLPMVFVDCYSLNGWFGFAGQGHGE